MHRLLTVLFLSASLLPAQHADDPSRPDFEFTATRAWFESQPDVPGPLRVLVAVRGDAEPIVMTRGAVDSAGTVRPDARTWLPLGGLSPLALHELVELEIEGGLDLDTSLRAWAPRFAVQVDEGLQSVSVRALLEGESKAASFQRWLAAGEAPRPAGELLAKHVFPRANGSTWDSLDSEDLLLQGALEERRGANWDALVRETVSRRWGDAELWPVRPPNAAPLAAWLDGQAYESWLDGEVASATSLHVRLDSMPSVLRAVLRPHGVRARWGDHERGDEVHGRSWWSVDGRMDVRMVCYDRGLDVAVFLLAAGEVEGYVGYWTNEAVRRLDHDLGVEVVESGEWNSAVGAGGRFGGRGGFPEPPELARSLLGTWTAQLPQVGDRPAPRIELLVPSTDPKAARLWFDGRPLAVTSWGRGERVSLRGLAPGKDTLEFDLTPTEGGLDGELMVTTMDLSRIPWRIRFEPTAEERSWPTWLPRVVYETGLPAKVSALHRATRRGGGVFALSNSQGMRWTGTYGHADAAGRLPMRDDQLLPLGSLSRTISALAAMEVLYDPEVAIGPATRLEDAWGDAAPELPKAVRGLTLDNLLHNETLAEFELRVEPSGQDLDLPRLLEDFALRRPGWVSGSPHDDLSVGLLCEAIVRANGYPTWSRHIARSYGRETFYTVLGVESAGHHATDLQRLGTDGRPRPWTTGVLPGADLWGQPLDALRLGEIALYQLASSDDRAVTLDLLRGKETTDGASRGFDGVLWEDRHEGEVRRLTVWPELDLVVFGFANQGDGAELRQLEQHVLDGYERGGAFSSAPFAESRGDFDASGTYGAVLDTVLGQLDWELEVRMRTVDVGDGFTIEDNQIVARVGGVEREFSPQYEDEDRLVGTVALEDGAELAFAIETAWLGPNLSGIAIVRRGDGARLPYRVTLMPKSE